MAMSVDVSWSVDRRLGTVWLLSVCLSVCLQNVTLHCCTTRQCHGAVVRVGLFGCRSGRSIRRTAPGLQQRKNGAVKRADVVDGGSTERALSTAGGGTAASADDGDDRRGERGEISTYRVYRVYRVYGNIAIQG